MSSVKQTEYLEFWLVDNKNKTQIYSVLTRKNHTFLGSIKWFNKWRQYTFHPETNTLFNKACLSDIINFIFDLMEKRKT